MLSVFLDDVVIFNLVKTEDMDNRWCLLVVCIYIPINYICWLTTETFSLQLWILDVQ